MSVTRNEITVRLAHSSELQTVQDLNHTLFISDNRHFQDLNLQWPYEEQGEKYFRGVIAGELGVCFVAERSDEVVGYLAGCIQKPNTAYLGKRAELENMFVKEPYRSQGVGSLLVDVFTSWAKDRGANYISVNAFSPNTRALAFYKKQGFSPYSITLWMEVDSL